MDRATYDWSDLLELYVDQKLSTYQIAELKGCARPTVGEALRRRGIMIRQTLCMAGRASEIHRAYCDEKLSIPEVASKLDLGTSTVSRYLPQKRTLSEALKIHFEKSHPGNFKGRVKCPNGYIKVYATDHPKKMSDNCVYEHILVWEEYHQKSVPQGWVIHHINGIRDDNRPENLLAMPRDKHQNIIPQMAMKIRQLEIENRQLRQALEANQAIFYISEN